MRPREVGIHMTTTDQGKVTTPIARPSIRLRGPWAAQSPNHARVDRLDPGGKVVVGGSGTPTQSPASVFRLARFNADGSFDNTFGLRGTIATAFNISDNLFEITRQPDGKVVAVGNTGASSDIAIALGGLPPPVRSFAGRG